MVDDIRGKQPSRPVSEDADDGPSFVPPETVANDEEIIDMSDEIKLPETGEKIKEQKGNKHKKPGKFKTWLGGIGVWFGKRTKKQKIALVFGMLVVLGLIGFGLYSVFGKQAPAAPPPAAAKKEVKVPPKPTTEASRLTGVQISPELNKLPVTGIMIENSPDARPQSGVKDAGVVFEAIAEGGITRFLTLFQEAQPDYIGPVRSVRLYYLSWLQGFDAPIAHAGGSAEALAFIRSGSIKDLDQFYNGGSYQRISSRYAPHNLYTSRASLLALQNSKGWPSSDFIGFVRKAEKPITPITAKTIDIAISGPLYNTHYDYDVTLNAYKRSQAGQPHVDERSGIQITPKVVIAIVVPYGIHSNGVNSNYQTIGSGVAYIFQDGGVTVGTWSKSSDKDQIRFGDANSAPIGINPGQTWITAVGAATNVTYQP